MVAGEEDNLGWMNELLCGGDASGGEEGGARTIQLNPLRQDDSDEDRDAQLEDLVDMRTCCALAVYLGVLVLVLIVACVLIVTQRFYAGDVVLCCIIVLYELSVLQVVAVAVARRRSAAVMGAAAAANAAQEASDDEDDDLEAPAARRDTQPAEPSDERPTRATTISLSIGSRYGARSIIAAMVAANARNSPLLLQTTP